MSYFDPFNGDILLDGTNKYYIVLISPIWFGQICPPPLGASSRIFSLRPRTSLSGISKDSMWVASRGVCLVVSAHHHVGGEPTGVLLAHEVEGGDPHEEH